MVKPAVRSEIRVLLVDDDQDDYVLTRDLLAAIPDRGYRLDWEKDFENALNCVCDGDYDVVLLDYRLGEKTGLDLLEDARRKGCEAPVIILTGLSDAEIDLAAMHRGAADYLEKTRLDSVLLDRTIRYSIQQRSIEAELERRVRERTEELNTANEALQMADRRKDEFLATLAHELRNPLAPIRNALEILRLSSNDPAVTESARAVMERQIHQLVRLIDDLLDVSRITQGKLRLVKEPVDLRQVIDSAIEQSRPVLEKAGQELVVELPAAEIRLHGDRLRLAQVFTNILNNAAKYSESGGVVRLTARQAGERVIVRIRDSGVGIPAEMLPRVFEPFSQVDRTLQRAQGGLGIGLNLVQRLVELHGGSVSARSDGPGHGAEFSVELPCEASPETNGGPPA